MTIESRGNNTTRRRTQTWEGVGNKISSGRPNIFGITHLLHSSRLLPMIQVKHRRTKRPVKAIRDIRSLITVMVGYHVVVEEAISHEVRISRAAEVGVLDAHNRPSGKGRVVGGARAVREETMQVVVPESVGEGVFGEVGADLGDIGVAWWRGEEGMQRRRG